MEEEIRRDRKYLAEQREEKLPYRMCQDVSKGNAGISLLKGFQKLSTRKCTTGNNTAMAGKWAG